MQQKFKEARERAFQEYIDLLDSSPRPILAFTPEVPFYPNKQLSKMFFLKKLELHNDDVFLNSAQPEATVVLMKKTSFTTAFVERWAYLTLCENYKLVDDNLYAEEELPEFRGTHRHDQSILSALSYKNNTHILKGQHIYGLSPFFAGRMTDEPRSLLWTPPSVPL